MIPCARLDDIDEAVIRDLIAHRRREGRTLDFKAKLDLSDKGRQSLADDICAFANTVGGDLVFGMVGDRDGDSAVASDIDPIVVEDLDAELLKLTNFLRDAIEPRVTTTLLSHAVPLAGGGHVVVLRVGLSPNAPHRVLRNNHFYLRNSVGKETMDIHAIRTAFAFADGLVERAIRFRDDRLARLELNHGSIPVADGPRVIVHVVPVLALTRQDAHSAPELLRASIGLARIKSCGSKLSAARVNLDGVVCEGPRQPQRDYAGYVQLFRNGSVELIGTDFMLTVDDERTGIIEPSMYEFPLVRLDFPAIAQTLASLGVPAPAYVFVSLTGIHRRLVHVRQEGGYSVNRALPIYVDQILPPPAYIEDFGADPLAALRPALDVIWNAVGIVTSQTDFDEPGL